MILKFAQPQTTNFHVTYSTRSIENELLRFIKYTRNVAKSWVSIQSEFYSGHSSLAMFQKQNSQRIEKFLFAIERRIVMYSNRTKFYFIIF